ncbi:hypothetical protein E2562_007702 [Oryza meyeriana var. granulata]|uniref:Uncharacterized protein n=1 Tax=Oryza meyeriana var. granulata TaxID=110450 RepID=A0A6G1EIQ9_9ORYZ|nr:hypothetical protein E2562_007702 [Oryza meyeriana var. granulata]
MECYYQYSNSLKEKRPPLKRGQLKWQIAKTLSNLMVPGGDVDQGDKPIAGPERLVNRMTSIMTA